MGGSGTDTFVYAAGDGVDYIGDFAIGQDRLDVANTWFDGLSSNGEFAARDYAGGALILFSDTSADGFVDNSAIYLVGIQASNVTAGLFI